MDQMLEKAKRIASWAKGKPLGPIRIEIHPTNVCNLKCKFCWQTTVEGKVDRDGELPDEKLLQLVDDAGALGVKEWIVSGGGESFVRGDATLNMMKRIKEHGMWGQLTTNAAILKESDIESIVAMGWDQVQISLDGPNAEIHDFLRSVPGTFDKAVAAAKLFSHYRKKLKKDVPYLGFNACITQKIHDRLDDMILLGKEVGFDLVFFEPVYAGYVSEHRLTLNKEEEKVFGKKAKKAKKLADRIGIATNADRFIRTELIDKSSFDHVVLRETEESKDLYLNAPCYQPWYLMGIKGNGYCGCCSTFEVGEFIHDKTLPEIWYGEVFNKIREEMLDRKLPDYCRKCSVVVVNDNNHIKEKLKKLRSGRKWL